MNVSMTHLARLLLALTTVWLLPRSGSGQECHVEFFNEAFSYTADSTIAVTFNDSLSTGSIRKFYAVMEQGNYGPLVEALLEHRTNHKLNDWLYYQLVRRVAQQLSPKGNN